MKTVKDSIDNINEYVAMRVIELVKEKPDAAIAFCAGKTFEGVFDKLSKSDADFSKVRALLVCDYSGLPGDDGRRCINILDKELFSKLGISEVYAPDENEPESFDDVIKSVGGLDLVLLGIGLNGHIGFNEPATPYLSYTHTAKLTDSTKRMKSELFGGFDNVPDYGVTMGLKTICDAKNVILTAFGEEKAQIIHELVYGKTLTYVPAAMLQMHMNMTLCIDDAAASKL